MDQVKELMSMNEAAERGIRLLRKPSWLNNLEHFKIDIVDGKPGPWGHLYSVINMAFNGVDPYDFLLLMNPEWLEEKCFEEYKGPIAQDPEYQRQSAEFLADYKKTMGEDGAGGTSP